MSLATRMFFAPVLIPYYSAYGVKVALGAENPNPIKLARGAMGGALFGTYYVLFGEKILEDAGKYRD